MNILKLVIPIYVIVLLGWWLKDRKHYTEEVNDFISFITYRILLPLSIFDKIATAEVDINNQTILFYGVMFAQMIVYYFLWTKLDKKQGFEAFVNSVRGNVIYLGFPVMIQILPVEILPLGMVLASALSPMTLFGVEVIYRSKESGANPLKILKNPLVQGLLVGVIFNATGIWHPLLGEVISQATKPLMFLALIIVGANFDISSMKDTEISLRMILVIFNKLILLPIGFTAIAFLLGFEPVYIAIGIILFSSPCAVSNFVLLAELEQVSDLTTNTTIFATAAYLLMLPLIGYLVNTLV
ncbi:MAG: AEC family transporter [Halanaerobiales bacterium]